MAIPVQRGGAAFSRRALLATTAAAAAVSLAGCGGSDSAPGLTPRPRRSSGVVATPGSSSQLVSLGSVPVPVLVKPVFTLADYRRAVPGRDFPAHAVALTIDDGPHPLWTPKILALLERYHVPATFFLIGNQVRGHESVARSVAAAGHHIANHTYTHPTTLSRLSPAAVYQEIERAQSKIHSTTGRRPTLFRPPGGAWSAPMMAQVARAGLIPIDWNDDPADWKKPGTATIASKLLAARPGAILLCHDGGGDRSQTYAALTTVIPALLARGYTFVAL